MRLLYSCLTFSLQHILTVSNTGSFHVPVQPALSQEIQQWVLKTILFPFFYLPFRKPKDSLPKQPPSVKALQGRPSSERLPALEKKLQWGNPS